MLALVVDPLDPGGEQQRAGRCARPVTIIVDSQSVKAAETVAKADRGYDAGNYLGLDVMPGRVDQGWPAMV
ncbi:hypothetical protein [Nonomuraea aurantiaca]|uniref:hypothetical protein n=1 Tax=Nonomuraea aurantiaca TaxID=2878562 RepID=UPI001CDA0589|nr:hypothetical protein [Nonomuraea aurantiaca]MCA2230240.1 hypothetical protein [Nonomuraea aurantiaca]